MYGQTSDGSSVYIGPLGVIQSHALGNGVLLHVSRGIMTEELARHVIEDAEGQLRSFRRCSIMVDGEELMFHTTEFREAMTRWFCSREEAVVHMLIRSNQLEMALGIANLAMGTPRAMAYTSVQQWEAVGRTLVPSFARRPLSIPADIHGKPWAAAVDALAAGDRAEALRLSEQATRIADLTGVDLARAACRCLYARALIANGQFDCAGSVLTEAHTLSLRSGSSESECISLLLRAQLEAQGGADRPTMHALLTRAFELSRETRALDTPWLSRASLADLCVHALEANVEVDHVCAVIRALGLTPRAPPLHVASWPWLVRVEALGRAAVMIDGRALDAGKAAELLFAALALGAEMPRQAIEAALWPDADGDRAHGALKTTLHRLRQAAGGQDFIRLVDGRLAVDRARCWSDIAAVVDVMTRIKATLEGSSTDPAHALPTALADRLFELYRGRFLPEHPAAWTVSVRERLHQRFLSTVMALGKALETRSSWGSAIEVYERGLLVDDSSEPLHRGIMRAYENMRAPAEALRAYERCRRVLLASMNVEPSLETRAIVARISDGKPNR